MPTFAILIGLGLTATAAPAADAWVNFFTDRAGTEYYMDYGRISSANGRTLSWMKADHAKNPAAGKASEVQQWSLICASRKARLVASTTYDAAGKEVKSEAFPETPNSEAGYEPVSPDTAPEALLTATCVLGK